MGVQYDEIQATLVEKVMAIIVSYAPAVELLCNTMDVLVALAHVASNAPTSYVRPSLTDAGTGDLVNASYICV